MRRRLYLMRHGAVDYVDARGRPVAPDQVPLTAEGRAQAEAARELLAGVELDRVIASGLPRTVETAELVAPGREIERWPDLREIMGAKLSSIPAGQLEEAFVRAFHGVVPNDKRFLGGETIGELFDRVLPALERLAADGIWDTVLVVAHGAVRGLAHQDLTARVDRVERYLLGAAADDQARRRQHVVGQRVDVEAHVGALARHQADAVVEVLDRLRHLDLVGDQVDAGRRRRRRRGADEQRPPPAGHHRLRELPPGPRHHPAHLHLGGPRGGRGRTVLGRWRT